MNNTCFPCLVKEFGLKKVRDMSCRYSNRILLELESVLADDFKERERIFAQIAGIFPDVS